MRTFDFDVAIIGGGSGGFAAARSAAGFGLRTVVVEGGEEVGGLCILRGCMPSKALLHAAELAHVVTQPNRWGVRAERTRLDFARAMARKNELIEEFARFRQQQLTTGKFKFIRAAARFADAHTLDLSTGDKLTAANFIIATGSTLAPAPLPDLNHAGFLTSDSALKLTSLPKSIIVLGGGAVAVEFAQVFARFGVETTLVQRSPHVLHDFDADAAAVLETVFRREGIAVHTGTRLLSARRLSDGCKEVCFARGGEQISVAAEEIFVALGRVPNTRSLGLETIGVKMDWGRITCDERMQSSVPHIYAAGDCTGLHEIVHIAVQQGEVAAHNIAGQTRRMDYRLFTTVIFTEPQIAIVGLTEKEAAARGTAFAKACYSFADHGKSMILDATDGFVKLLAEPQTGEILGGCCVGPSGGELIHEIIAAMAKRMTVHELAAMPHYHPTLAEIWTYPAEELAETISKPSQIEHR